MHAGADITTTVLLKGGGMTRPAETISATAASVIGAILIIAGALDNGFQFSDLNDPEVTGAITVIVGFVAAVVTWYTARKQRQNALGSAADGTVTKV